jgi:hypothetical protein
MAFRGPVTPMRTGAETLRWGSVRGLGESSQFVSPLRCRKRSAPTGTEDQSKLVPGDVGVC